MSEFSAFLVGLILGESTSRPINTSNKKPLHSNIALQDVTFCQALRNIIDGLEDYVQKDHPSPEEFIRHILPDENFTEPYTEEEKNIIADNKNKSEAYVKWIKSVIALTGESWENLTAVKMIWRDEAHTPDIDNLDLLFGVAHLSKPIKKNGRVYEYDTDLPMEGLAKGFFETIPANIIRALCCQYAFETVKNFGYQYDWFRFEYNYSADKQNNITFWKLYQRKTAYRLLLKEMPDFCNNPWSDLTRELIKEKPVKIPEKQPDSGNDKSLSRAREDERLGIINNLYTKEERIEMYRAGVEYIETTTSIRAYRLSVYAWWIFIAICVIAFIIIVLKDSFEPGFARNSNSSIFLESLALVGVFWYLGNKFWRIVLECRAQQHVIKEKQDAYYNNSDLKKAAEYKVLLDKLNELKKNGKLKKIN